MILLLVRRVGIICQASKIGGIYNLNFREYKIDCVNAI